MVLALSRIMGGVFTKEGAEKEIEHTFYCLLSEDELTYVKQHPFEVHEQAEIEMVTKRGTLRTRTRKTTSPDESPTYVFTTKTKIDNGIMEHNVDHEDIMLVHGDYMAISDRISRKTRYSIPVQGLSVDVDIYIKPDGTEHNWVKVDIEVPSIDVDIPELPFNVEDSIYVHPDKPMIYKDSDRLGSVFWNVIM